MSKFLFLLTRGPEDPTRAVRTLLFAKLAAEKGHQVKVFLADDAVYLTNLYLAERVKAPTGDEFKDHLKALLEKKVEFYVCKPCADARMIGEDDLPTGFKMAIGSVLIDEAVDSKVFSF